MLKDPLPGFSSAEFTQRIVDLKRDIVKLEDYESTLDRHQLWIEQSIRNVTEDLDNTRYLYLTTDDFARCFGNNKSVIAMNVPLNSNLQCGQTEGVVESYTLKVRSASSPITANIIEENGCIRNGQGGKRTREVSDRLDLEEPSNKRTKPTETDSQNVENEEDTDLVTAEVLFRKQQSTSCRHCFLYIQRIWFWILF